MRYLSTCSKGYRSNSSDSNAFLESKGVKVPKATSTGTTIVGCLFKDGIVLGADTRATTGPIVADKNCEKVRQSGPWAATCLIPLPPRGMADELSNT